MTADKESDMMDPKKARWIEMQFYFILFDVWKLHNNFRDILDFVRLMKFFGEFNESRVCSLAQDALINRYLNLNSAEYLILCWLNHVPLKAMLTIDYDRCWLRLEGHLKRNAFSDERANPRIQLIEHHIEIK
jgi:hypothetical protein